MAITRLYLVRHGATQLSAEDRFAGDVSADLSAEGRAQAERLAARLRDDAIDAIYCSPLSRPSKPHASSLVAAASSRYCATDCARSATATGRA